MMRTHRKFLVHGLSLWARPWRQQIRQWLQRPGEPLPGRATCPHVAYRYDGKSSDAFRWDDHKPPGRFDCSISVRHGLLPQHWAVLVGAARGSRFIRSLTWSPTPVASSAGTEHGSAVLNHRMVLY